MVGCDGNGAERMDGGGDSGAGDGSAGFGNVLCESNLDFVAGAVAAAVCDAVDEEDMASPAAAGFEDGALDGDFPFM